MPELDLAQQWPAAVVGVITGLLAFAPLALAVVPVMSRRRAANMVMGMVGVASSFAILFLGVLVAWVVARDAFLAYFLGELVGFVGSLIALSLAAIARGDFW